jgi:hypothetical protein
MKNIYRSARWLKLRSLKMSIDPLCEACTKPTPGFAVDHIQEISAGGEAWSLSNLMTLCEYHHNKKTASRRAGKAWYGEIDVNGYPVGGDHPWSKEQPKPKEVDFAF